MSERKQENERKVRVQFDFAPRSLEQLDELKEVTGAGTRAEVVRTALQIYGKFVLLIQSGAEIYAQNRDGSKEKIWIPNSIESVQLTQR